MHTSAATRHRLARVHHLRRQRYTRAEIAKTLGISTRTVSRDFRRLDALASDPGAQAQTATARLLDALALFTVPDSFDALLAVISDPLTLDRPLPLSWLFAASHLDSDACPEPVEACGELSEPSLSAPCPLLSVPVTLPLLPTHIGPRPHLERGPHG